LDKVHKKSNAVVMRKANKCQTKNVPVQYIAFFNLIVWERDIGESKSNEFFLASSNKEHHKATQHQK